MWAKRLLLCTVKALYRRQLHEFLKAMPAEVIAEALAASEKMTGPVIGFTQD